MVCLGPTLYIGVFLFVCLFCGFNKLYILKENTMKEDQDGKRLGKKQHALEPNFHFGHSNEIFQDNIK